MSTLEQPYKQTPQQKTKRTRSLSQTALRAQDAQSCTSQTSSQLKSTFHRNRETISDLIIRKMLAKHFLQQGATPSQEQWVRHEVKKFVESRRMNEGSLKNFDEWVASEIPRKTEAQEWDIALEEE